MPIDGNSADSRQATQRRTTLSTRRLGAAFVAAAGGALGVPGAAAAIVVTHFANTSCKPPGWVGAFTRSPISTSVFINGAHRCVDSGSHVGWVHAWINDMTRNIIFSTGTEHQIAATGLHVVNHDVVRDFAKLNSPPTNPFSHVVTASSFRNP